MSRRPTATERLDLGFEIMDRLLVERKPLTDDQVCRYIEMWLGRHWLKPTRSNIRKAAAFLNDKVALLSRCQMPIPMAVIEQVCLCKTTTLQRYNWKILHPFRLKVMDGKIWENIPLDQIPKFDNLMLEAFNHKMRNEN